MSIFLLILYFLVLILVCIRIILNTSTPSKGLAYLLLVFLFPLLGIIFYLSVGLNYRKNKLYNKKIDIDEINFLKIKDNREVLTHEVLTKHENKLSTFYPLVNFLNNKSIISDNNDVSLLINGEEKFPEIIKSLKAAKHHIHIEYYIYENDHIGNQIAELLISKVKEGVEVRFIYDDFGSKSIRSNIVKQLKAAGVDIFPFYKINFVKLANRINYRNHRKVIIIDGITGFVGGINMSDKYNNNASNKLYWRDTHLKIVGSSVLNLQFVFLTDWNFCAQQNIAFSDAYFPVSKLKKDFGNQIVQVVASGPDSDYPNIMYALIQVILLAKKELLITTPYLIPPSSFLNAIKIASLSGVDVKLLVPGTADSFIVNTTSQSFYEELMEAGIKIYKYNRGFVHSKTIVCDRLVSSVGTANLDNRSFDLNFEINAVVYSKKTALELTDQFHLDILDADQINLTEWKKRPRYIKLLEQVLHLFSALM